MANKLLQSIKFPGLADTYTVPQIDDTLSVEGRAADAKVTGDKIDELKSGLTDICTLTNNLLLSAAWEEGTINLTSGVDAWSTSTIRTGYIDLNDAKKIVVNLYSGYKYVLALINAEKTSVLHYFGWTTVTAKDYDISSYNATYARLLLQKTDNTKPSSGSYITATYYNDLLSTLKENAFITDYVRNQFIIHYSHDGNGSYFSNNTRNAIIKPMVFPFDVLITSDTDYDFAYQIYDGEQIGSAHLINASNWLNSALFTAGTYFCLIIRNDDGTDTTTATNNHLYAQAEQLINDQIDFIYNIIANDKKTIADLQTTVNALIADTGNYCIGQDFIKKTLNVSNRIGILSGAQAFCIYDNKYYSLSESKLYVQDSSFTQLSETSLSFGHGNAIQRGSGDLAYISGWNDNTIYIINLTEKSIIGSIALPTIGYTTGVIDDVNKIAYVFQRDTYPDTEVPWTFIAYDYDNEEVLYTRKTPSFAAIQGCDFVNGSIFVVSGLGTAGYPSLTNYYRVYNTSGDYVAQYIIPSFASREPEGVFVDRDTFDIYLDIQSSVYKVN